MLNKKLLAAAIVGTLAAGNAGAANLSGDPGGAAHFAKEIVATVAAPRVLTTSASADTSLTWDIGYNFSDNEVRYARVQCSDNIKLDAASVTSSGSAQLGSVNGLNTNVLTFSITSPVGTPIVESDTLTIVGDHGITGTDTDVTCSVALYDQPSQAQTGGTVGLLQDTYFTGPYISFAPSYELVATATEHTADVEADPSFSDFVVNANTTLATASLGNDGLAGTIAYRVRDPDGAAGAQTATFGINGAPVTLATLLAAGTNVVVAGDYSLTANAAAPLFVPADARVQLNGANASALTASSATFAVGNTGFAAADFDLTRRDGNLIRAAEYTATLDVVAAAAADYRVTDITGVKFGSIVRNGTELQAPLVQIPGGWTARVVLTNTGGLARPYNLSILTETGASFVLDPAKLTGTVPAHGTVVVQLTDADLAANSGRRGTVIANVAGPTGQIQGLYQIVNPANGLVNNTVLIRPATN